MLYFNLAMLGIAVWFILTIFIIKREVGDGPNGSKISVIVILAKRRPGFIQAILFILITCIIYWVFI
jgi:hypothetical protein